MKVTVKQVIAAIISVASMFVPLPLRWIVRLLAESFREQSAKMSAAAAEEGVTAAAPEELKTIIQSLFDTLNSFLAGRPFVLAVVKALQSFILANLIDAIWDQLFNGGQRTTAGAVPMHYNPADCGKLQEEVDAAVALG